MLDQNHNIYRERVDFSKIKTVFELPDLLEIQRKSYDEFLQMDLLPEERKDVGLQAAFKDVFPIKDFKETTELQFINYTVGDWECKCGRLKGVDNSRPRCRSCGVLLPSEVALQEKRICPYCGEHKKIEMPLCEYCGDRVRLKIKYSPLECIQKGYTYEAPLKIKVRLVLFGEKSSATGERLPKLAKESEVYFGNVPLMTDKGTFIFNGVERVVVSQLQRSPGVFFRPGEIKGQFVGKVIPYRGAWVEFENDVKNILWVRLDRKKKFLATVFLRALGYGSDEEIIRLFFKSYELIPEDGKLYWKVTDNLVGKVLREDVYTPDSSRSPIARAGTKLDQELIKKLLEKKVTRIKATRQDLHGACSLVNIRGKVKAGEELSAEQLEILTSRGEPFEVFFPAEDEAAQMILNTLKKDLKKDQQQALSEIYKKLRPGEPHTEESAKRLFLDMFYNPHKFNISRIGRKKFNLKLGLEDSRKDFLKELEKSSELGDPNDIILKKEDYYKLINFIKENFEDLKKLFAEKGDFKKLIQFFENCNRLISENNDWDKVILFIQDPNARSIYKDYEDFVRIQRLIKELIGRILFKEDYVKVIRYLLGLKKGEGSVDDIDHLGNRRVRPVGELMENAFRIGLTRMERTIKEKMTISTDLSSAMPQDLINSKPVIAALKEFFGSSQLSQFMDQINTLAELTHKRRLSALGPGGLSRERAGFEVRDIQTSHYGRICPIETPEGPNIGLIASLSCYARINEYGFIETPYRKVEKGRVVDYVKVIHPGATDYRPGQLVRKDEMEKVVNRLQEEKARNLPIYEPYIFYLTAWEEENFKIAQANVEIDSRGYIKQEMVSARDRGNFKILPREEIDFMDVSPKQLVSLSAALIPFLEHDDANRALMGSNMQRQAVPLLKPEAPLIGTGIEHIVAKGSGDVVVCERSGVVEFVDAERIIVRVDEKENSLYDLGTDLYLLTKFLRTNQNTCINQRPIVRKGDRVVKGQILADGSCTDRGEIALGRNILCAFMPWRGYNFEDAIIVSEKLIKEDVFTSIHIVEEMIEARDTKLGPEEITRDIPNVSENLLRNLDETGIVRIGAYVKPGDILVGKVAPKGETQLSPEEKLLKAIFGEKALDVKDASLYCPPGVEGTVIDVRIFTRRGQEKNERAKAIEKEEIAKMKRNLEDEIEILEKEKWRRIKNLIKGEVVGKNAKLKGRTIEKGTKLTEKLLEILEFDDLKDLEELKLPPDAERDEKIRDLERKVKRQIDALKAEFKEKVDTLKKGDELSPGVIQAIKVFIAMKRRLSVGDKMSGRHGNKGVIAKIVPEEDMPRLPDGTPVDIVLNPLGVPSRMNLGQILETHAGWAARKMNLWLSSPVFDGAQEEEIKELLRKAGLPETGKIRLYDGLTGQPFDQEVTVGYIYMMKLYHLVDDKIHARSTGPYSLITQQPLGGKAQFGGQRFGEMEVWALEAYGAAYTLQEILTVKSDDVEGRAKIYEAIVKGDLDFQPGLPESVNVLIRELQGLSLNIELLKGEKEEALPWGITIPQSTKGD